MPERRRGQEDAVLAEILREVRGTNRRVEESMRENADIQARLREVETSIEALRSLSEERAELYLAWTDAKRWSRLMLRIVLTGAAVIASAVVIVKQGDVLMQMLKHAFSRR